MPFELGKSKTNGSDRFTKKRIPVIKVIGVGGAGNNAINRMVEIGIKDVSFIAVNTDVQVLEENKANIKIQIGEKRTRGLGAGGDPQVGEEAAEESREELEQALQDADMLFITAGFGGGTGTGATPVIAEIAKSMGALTVAVITTPFYFEGKERWNVAVEGLRKLRKNVDTLIRISNNKLLEELPPDVTVVNAFLKADETLHQGVKGISELITKRGYINLDFADVESVMRNAGAAMLGIGLGKGENRAVEAAKRAMESKLMDRPVENAKAIILNVSAPRTVQLREMHVAAAIIRENCSEDADVKFGLIIDDELENDELRVTLIATGFDEEDRYLFPESEIPAVYRLGLEDMNGIG
ncbi:MULTISPECIES: cell division protein FtsZ [Pseudothermotoga]|jgi:cell division protein FtsZ|uniref:Cell division protein FtsZ n=1 Tax=Pseudothermotoga lettingae (strain ATCC BAA-301 / DSM 14385 / NBRC 107922 / TMO) TaxID=416591 RepID=A8F634_PSELT|nr:MULTISPECIES: cell division protein FtsZ [Pseudothermotoga]ABV33618.1 cell division protein FtsZ [Pseudothermotoga lettingae TMO]KUK21568.1 MAG: Cell division protein FtsZ [Pseudothermotoga lettingae]MDI3495070.1 cell division protein FtsZ [Pseudothermotoga sp.]MDK2883732.1 cell division protein FtsZ [Pseudothermotoga sp.]GLI49466.1 cell division protein FtsZ [Pseudothermotoga lettingae TMO]